MKYWIRNIKEVFTLEDVPLEDLEVLKDREGEATEELEAAVVLVLVDQEAAQQVVIIRIVTHGLVKIAVVSVKVIWLRKVDWPTWETSAGGLKMIYFKQTKRSSTMEPKLPWYYQIQPSWHFPWKISHLLTLHQSEGMSPNKIEHMCPWLVYNQLHLQTWSSLTHEWQQSLAFRFYLDQNPH